MHCEGQLKSRSLNTSSCLIEEVTKGGLTVLKYNQIKKMFLIFQFQRKAKPNWTQLTSFNDLFD